MAVSANIKSLAVPLVIVLVLCGGWCLLSCCIVSAHPNEWLLVISDGKLKSAGVGTTEFLGLFDKPVKFPASIRKVTFSAQQVSKEMQGIEVSGFLVWAVYREGDGPFKAYKYGMVGSADLTVQADNNIRGMAESIVRHQVANLGLAEVIANRELLRNTVRAEMLKVVQGWGMWLETVEVTDVRVLSQKVFDDLQTEFRQNLYLKAEAIRMNTSKDLKLQRLVQDNEKSRIEAETRAEQAKRDLWIQLETQKQQSLVNEESHKMELEQIQREHSISLERSKNAAKVKEFDTLEEMKLTKQKVEAELELLKARMEVEKNTPKAMLQKDLINAVRDIYAQLPIREVKLFNSANGNGLDNLIPGLAQISEILKTENNQN